jgi:hypothetical protein
VTTHQIIIVPSAIVVGLPGEHVALCHEVFGERGLKVHAHDDANAAAEAITKLLPQLVVASANLVDRARIEDVTVAVGAVFLLLADVPDYVAIERQLESAVSLARERFGKSRSR